MPDFQSAVDTEFNPEAAAAVLWKDRPSRATQ
jgi:acetyl-CoA carboxylase alpha subunit